MRLLIGKKCILRVLHKSFCSDNLVFQIAKSIFKKVGAIFPHSSWGGHLHGIWRASASPLCGYAKYDEVIWLSRIEPSKKSLNCGKCRNSWRTVFPCLSALSCTASIKIRFWPNKNDSRWQRTLWMKSKVKTPQMVVINKKTEIRLSTSLTRPRSSMASRQQ